MATTEIFTKAVLEATARLNRPLYEKQSGMRDLHVPPDFWPDDFMPLSIKPSVWPMRISQLISLAARGWVVLEDGQWYLSHKGFHDLRPALIEALRLENK